MNIIFIAPPAAGKGTQSALLEEKYEYKHLSTGDLLREEIKKGNELGDKIQEIISKGELVSDDIITELLTNELESLNGEKFILDGYPRNLKQAETLKEIFTKLNITNYAAIYLDIDEETATKRVLGRIICSKCGASYNKYFQKLMPKEEGICDRCGGELSSRSDDNEETFKTRFKTYMDVTSPVLDYYKNEGKLHIIEAQDDSETTFKKIEEILESETVDNN